MCIDVPQTPPVMPHFLLLPLLAPHHFLLVTLYPANASHYVLKVVLQKSHLLPVHPDLETAQPFNQLLIAKSL